MQSEQSLLYSWQTEDKFPLLDHCQPQPTLTNAMLSSSFSGLPWTIGLGENYKNKRQILSWFSTTCPYILSGFVFIGIRWSFVIPFYKNTTFSRQFYRLDLSLFSLMQHFLLISSLTVFPFLILMLLHFNSFTFTQSNLATNQPR